MSDSGNGNKARIQSFEEMKYPPQSKLLNNSLHKKFGYNKAQESIRSGYMNYSQ